ncbi:MAG: tetratricopeptide repeat protein, partial [Flavisolibacter sp.]
MLRVLCAILFSFTGLVSFPQNDKEKFLLNKVSVAGSESEKIDALNELAEYYFIFKLDKKADSILRTELAIAELSNNKDLIFQVLFSKAIMSVGVWTSAESFNRTETFLDKGMYHAKESRRQDYQAIAHIRKALLYRKKKDFEKAMEQATLAFSSLGNTTKHDSLKSSLYLELGEIFLAKGDAISAYKQYNNAFDIAYAIRNIPLQSETYHRIAALYQSMGNKDLAKDHLIKSLDLNKTHKYLKGLVSDYIDLARITDEKQYIEKAEVLASVIGSDMYIMYSKMLMHAYMMVIEKNSSQALAYLENNKDLKSWYLNQGISNYYWTIGNIYKYCDKPDSALYFYNLAEPEFKKIFDKPNLQTIYYNMAECYVSTNKIDTAIKYFEQSYKLSTELNNLRGNAAGSLRLSKLYAQQLDYKNAFHFSERHTIYQDSLKQLAAQRDVALLEMERERRKHEKDMADQVTAANNKRILQYMSISIAIVGIFFFMIILGSFPVSKFTIKLLGYFSFICLFEFIVLLL